MKKTEMVNLITEYLDEHVDPVYLDVPNNVVADSILYILENNGMRLTEEDPILYKRHVAYWERENVS